MNFWKKIFDWFKPKKSIKPKVTVLVRQIVDTQAIRDRIKTQGWVLRELPIQRTCPETKVKKVAQWKIIAFKGEKSVETSGTTIDDAIKNIGKTLGVISRES